MRENELISGVVGDHFSPSLDVADVHRFTKHDSIKQFQFCNSIRGNEFFAALDIIPKLDSSIGRRFTLDAIMSTDTMSFWPEKISGIVQSNASPLMKQVFTFCFVILALGCPIHRIGASTFLSFTSSPQSYIGQGQSQTLSDGFTASRTFNLGVYTNSVHFNAGGYELVIVGPALTLPTVGLYASATRWPFMGSGAGMDFTAPGRGNNTLTGSFNVLQADYDAGGQVAAFAVDFEIFEEGVSTKWDRGSVRYNSSIAVPEPGSTALGLFGIVAVYLSVRSRSSKSDHLQRRTRLAV